MAEQDGIPISFSEENFKKLKDAGVDVEEELTNALRESLLEVLKEELETETDPEKRAMAERIAFELEADIAK